MISLAYAMEKVRAMAGLNNSLNEAFGQMTDAFVFLSSINRDLNLHRREALRPSLPPTYRPACSAELPITDELFGEEEDLQRIVKEKSEVYKLRTGNQVRRPQGSYLRGNYRRSNKNR